MLDLLENKYEMLFLLSSSAISIRVPALFAVNSPLAPVPHWRAVCARCRRVCCHWNVPAAQTVCPAPRNWYPCRHARTQPVQGRG